MGKVKSELLDWEANYEEAMDDPESIALYWQKYKECMDKQQEEILLKKINNYKKYFLKKEHIKRGNKK
mgnify:FL=1|tara:strand:- start:3300 stop:3503 length:204 start_codon:yes stop_codon:yes gene_type:complete